MDAQEAGGFEFAIRVLADMMREYYPERIAAECKTLPHQDSWSTRYAIALLTGQPRPE